MSYLNDSDTRARYATTLPPSTFMSSFETSAIYRSIFDVVRDFLHEESLGADDKVLARYLKYSRRCSHATPCPRA